MRIMMAPIAVVARFPEKDLPRPVKFRLEQNGEVQEIKIDRIVTREEERLAGNRMLIFGCQSTIRGVERRYELKYEVATCRWYLSKA